MMDDIPKIQNDEPSSEDWSNENILKKKQTLLSIFSISSD
jgi:hypothetical protein